MFQFPITVEGFLICNVDLVVDLLRYYAIDSST